MTAQILGLFISTGEYLLYQGWLHFIAYNNIADGPRQNEPHAAALYLFIMPHSRQNILYLAAGDFSGQAGGVDERFKPGKLVLAKEAQRARS